MAVTINGTTGITTPDITTDSATVDTTTLVVDETNNRVGVGTASPTTPLHIYSNSGNNHQIRLQNAYSTGSDWTLNAYGANGSLFISNTADRVEINSSGDFKFNSGYGSAATAYGVRVWVNFQGNAVSGGNNPIRGSGNVSTVGDNGVGNHYVNFSTAMPDTNYCVVTGATRDYDAPSNNAESCTGDLETGRFNINTYYADSATANDWEGVHAMVVR